MNIVVEQINENTRQFTNRLPWLDILKGVGSILVVIGHVYSNGIVYDWLYSFHMPLFFMAAGWVYRKRSIHTDLIKRLQTIVVPYFSFGLLILLYWAALERHFRNSSMTIMESILGLLRGQYDYLDFNVHLWFLPCFFALVILYNTLMNINETVAYGAVIFMSVVYIISPLPQLPWGIDRIFKYIGFYAVGNILAEKRVDELVRDWISGHNIADKRKASKCVWGGVLIIVLIWVNFCLSFFDLTTGIMWFVSGMIGVSSVVIFALMINNNKILQYIGKMSLIILCIHGPVYRILVKALSIPLHMTTNEIRENFVLAMIVVSVTLAICAVVYEVVLRIAPWMIGKRDSSQKRVG